MLPQQIGDDSRQWVVGKRLASGGFGFVHELTGEAGPLAVAKFIPRATGVTRDLLQTELSGKQNILPVITVLEEESYFIIVMPRADRSLRNRIQEGGIDTAETIFILLDIASGLQNLGIIVHRDLKPENVLLYEGKWCLTDFGLSRYADAITSANTKKHKGTAAYAAPEQWRGERCTAATDVYAFGIIAYELLSGDHPFSADDYNKAHLTQVPTPLANTQPQLRSMVAACLGKAQDSRPSVVSVLQTLQDLGVGRPRHSLLAAAHAAVVERDADRQAELATTKLRAERRQTLFNDANTVLDDFWDQLTDRIQADAPTAAREMNPREIWLGSAGLILSDPEATQPPPICSGSYCLGFDVVCCTELKLLHSTSTVFVHSLWYCDAYSEGQYRWFELSFRVSPFRHGNLSKAELSYALGPDHREAISALTNGTTSVIVHTFPRPIDQSDLPQTTDRWIGWFARCATSEGLNVTDDNDRFDGQGKYRASTLNPDPNGGPARGRRRGFV